MDETALTQAAEAIANAEALLIGAGAGIGVDSGLPDFRGGEGFWKAYPPYAKLKKRFEEMANPEWFDLDPAMAWGFYGHRTNLYRATTPHAGFAILLKWAARMKHGSFVFTSNVDGHFQKAGFDPDRVLEAHGTLHYLQCMKNCPVGIFPAPDGPPLEIDEETMRAREPLPACPECGELARPNVLMFGDYGWDEARTAAQQRRLWKWWDSLPDGARVVVVELGAGTVISTVRRHCENAASRGTLIRINPREPQVPRGHIGLAAGALEALRALDARVDSLP